MLKVKHEHVQLLDQTHIVCPSKNHVSHSQDLQCKIKKKIRLSLKQTTKMHSKLGSSSFIGY